MFNFWWLAEWSEQITLTKTEKNEKGPLSHRKIKCLFLDYVQLLSDQPSASEQKTGLCWPESAAKNEKGPLSHRKIKCLFLDYVQLLMIGRAIWAKNVDQNTKKWKRPPKSSKNKMDYIQLLRFGRTIWAKNVDLKCKKNEKGPLIHQKIKCLFWIMFNFWWSAWANKQKKMKKAPKSWKIKAKIVDQKA